MVSERTAERAGTVLENTMFGFIGAHFVDLVIVGFALFAATLGYVSITDNLSRGS